MAVGSLFSQAHLVTRKPPTNPTAEDTIFSELIPFLALLAAAAVVAFFEHRSLLDFNLRGPRRPLHFFSGLIIGFLALSALIGALAWGHWLRIGTQSLSAGQLFRYALLWACAFLLVGCVEEGTFRCYLQFTLTRGINFWWALGVNATICLDLVVRTTGNGVWGDYAIVLLGVVPVLHSSPQDCRAQFFLAGGLGHLHALRLCPYWQRRRKLDRHFCRRRDRFCLLRQHLGHRFGLVGHRLPCRLGLGRNLFLRHGRQWPARARSPVCLHAGRQCALERRKRRP